MAGLVREGAKPETSEVGGARSCWAVEALVGACFFPPCDGCHVESGQDLNALWLLGAACGRWGREAGRPGEKGTAVVLCSWGRGASVVAGWAWVVEEAAGGTDMAASPALRLLSLGESACGFWARRPLAAACCMLG